MSKQAPQDLVDLLKAKQPGESPEAGSDELTKTYSLDEIIYKASLQNGISFEKVRSLLIPMMKDIGTTDLTDIRLVSLYPVISQKFNPETKLLNICRRNPIFRATDILFQMPDEDIGSDSVQEFNMDTTDQLDNAQSSLSSRTNVIQAFGNAINVSWMAQALAEQGPYNRDEVNRQLAMQQIRMDRKLNAMLCTHVKQTNEALPNVPAMEGLFTASTSNSTAVGGGNLTDAFITGAVDDIATGYGYDLNGLIALTNAAQIPVVRDLMINRYPGTDPMSKFNYDSVLSRSLAAVGVDYQMVYEDDNGVVIGFIRETQAPSGQTLIFNPDELRLAGFQLMGQFGPWVVERPQVPLNRLIYYFDLKSLVMGNPDKRAKLTGHA